MKRSKRFLCVAAAAAALASASGAAHARVFVGVGVGMGMPYYSPYYAPYAVAPLPYYPAYPYPAPVIAAPAPPPDYIEQAPPVAVDPGPAIDAAPPLIDPDGEVGPDDTVDQQDGSSWYYCDASKTYYPYVKECASGWRPVPATPDSSD